MCQMTSSALNDLLLPVETTNRELDAKLLLALFAAEAGFRCHVGAMSRILQGGFPPSIYVSKSVRFAKQVKLMAQLGHTIVAWDEEGLVRFKDEVHQARIEPEAFTIPSLLFSWGPSNSAVWRSHPFYNGVPIVDSGNPRIDLLRKELHRLNGEGAARLRERYGSFALLNTNFSFVNHYKSHGRKPKVARNSYDSETFLTFKREVDDHKRRLFQCFQAAVPNIAAAIAPNHLVIRPHPSEDRSPWERAAAGLANVSVVYESPVTQWLMAASCVIHNGCTSAVEAAVLGRPVVAYRPIVDPDLDFFLPNALSENLADLDGLCRRVRALLVHGGLPATNAPNAALLRDNLSALDGPLASERIVAALDRLRQSDSRNGYSSSPLAAYAKLALRSAKRLVSLEDRRYERHKSDECDFTVDKLLARARLMAPAPGRFESLTFEQRATGVVTIYGALAVAPQPPRSLSHVSQ